MDKKELNKTESSSTNIKPVKKKKEAEELIINFKYDEDPSYLKYQSSKRKYSYNFYDNVDIMDQSRFKFILNPITQNDSPEKYTKYTNIRESISWFDIHKIIYYSVEVYTCPICLENEMLVPNITRCGHIFCYPCILQYFIANNGNSLMKKYPKCPLCKELVKLEELKLCEVRNLIQLKEGDYYNSTLIMKEKSYPTVLNVSFDPNLEGFYQTYSSLKFIPFISQEEYSFSRIFIDENINILYQGIVEDLEKALNEEVTGFADKGRIEVIKICIDNMRAISCKTKTLIENKEIYTKNQEITPENTQTTNSNSPEFTFFYQEENGDIYYLHPLNHSMVMSEFGDYSKLPTKLKGKILEIEVYQMNRQIQLKYPFLNHLKHGNLFYIVEVDMGPLISGQTLKDFGNALKNRAKFRHSIKKEEEHYDDYVNKIKESEDIKLKKQYRSFNFNERFKESITFGNEVNNKNEGNLTNTELKDSNIESEEKKGNLKKLFTKETKKEESKLETKEPKEIKFLLSNELFPEISSTKDDQNKVGNTVNSSNSLKSTSKKLGKKNKQKYEELNIDIYKKESLNEPNSLNITEDKQNIKKNEVLNTRNIKGNSSKR